MKYILSYVALFLIGLTALYLSHSFSSDFLERNIDQTIALLEEEGTYPSVNYLGRSPVLDNFTDALMINTAWSVNHHQPLKASLTNLRQVISFEEVNQISNLQSARNGTAAINAGYERYWHGYLVVLRPLLVLFSYYEIRMLVSMVLLALVATFIYLANKSGLLLVSLLFVLGLLAVDLVIVGRSLQFSSVFVISLISMNLILVVRPKINYLLLFFIIGCVTSFFDLLTAPLLTLGLPLLLVTYLETSRKEKYSVVHTIKLIITYCLAWSIGYLFFWATKWLIVEQLYIPNAVMVAFDQVVNRTVTQADQDFNLLNTVWRNLRQLMGQDLVNWWILISITLGSSVMLIIKGRFAKENVLKATPFAVIGLMPLAWFVVVANHSYLHCWYTYRILAISVISYLLIVHSFVANNGHFNRLKKIK